MSKVAPIVGAARVAITGKTYIGEEFDPERPGDWIDELAPLALADISEAFEESGFIVGMLSIPAATLGIGVISYTDLAREWAEDTKIYFDTPTDSLDRQKAGLDTRTQQRDDNADLDAKLFITKQVSSLRNNASANRALELMAENNISMDDIPAIEKRIKEKERYSEAGKTLEWKPIDLLIKNLKANQPGSQPKPTQTNQPAVRQPTPPRVYSNEEVTRTPQKTITTPAPTQPRVYSNEEVTRTPR